MGIAKIVFGLGMLAAAAAGGAYVNELTHRYDDEDDDDEYVEDIDFYDVADFVRNSEEPEESDDNIPTEEEPSDATDD